MEVNQQINKTNLFSQASLRQRAVAGAVFLGIAAIFGLLWLDSADKISIGRWTGPCGFKQRYNLPCPTCGITTAAVTFTSGKIFRAFYIQPAGALLCCILVITAFLAFIIAVFGVYFGFVKRFFETFRIRHLILELIIIILAGWAVTLFRAIAYK